MRSIKLTLQQKLFLALGIISLLSVIYISSRSGISPLSPPGPTTVPLPAKTNPPQNPQFEKFQISSVTLSPSFSLPSLPETLSVYRAQTAGPDYLTLASDMARYFQLSPSDYSKTTWTNKDGTRSVKIHYENQTIAYQYNPPLSSASIQKLPQTNVEAAIKLATDLIKNFSEWNNYSVQNDQIDYLQSGSGEYVLSTSEQSDIIRIPLIENMGDYSLRYTNQNSAPLTLYVGPGDTIFKLVYIPRPYTVSPDPQPTVVTSSENILSYVKAGQVQVLDAFRESFSQSLNQPVQITLQSVSIEYHFLPQKQIVAPYYLFSGTFRQSASSSYEQIDQPVLFILPVVDL